MKIKAGIIIMIMTFCFPSVFAADIPDISNADVIYDDGEIFDTTTAGYSETGSWQTEGKGFENRTVRVSREAEAQAKWNISPGTRTYYEVYIWKNIVEGGDEKAVIDIYATGTSQGSIEMNLAEGKSCWEYAGIYYPSDGYIMITMRQGTGGKLAACAFRMVKTTQEKFYEFRDGKNEAAGIVFEIGADTAFVNGKTIPLTMGRAEIENNRTIVPVRFIAESFGGSADWNEKEKKVSIKAAGKTIDFYIGSNVYRIDGAERQIDTAAVIKDNRTYIPVRFLAEALEKTVEYKENTVTIK